MLGVLALTAMGLVIADVATFVSVRSYLVRRVDEQLVGVSGSISRRYDREGLAAGAGQREGGSAPAGPTSFFIERQDSTGSVIDRVNDTVSGARDSMPALPSVRPADAGAYTQPFTVASFEGLGPSWRALAVTRTDGTTAFVAVPLSELGDTLDQLLLIELAVSAVVLGLVGTLGWWVVGLGLRPLHAMEVTADAIAEGELSARVEITEDDIHTEVGHLGHAMNRMLGRIEEAIGQREDSEQRLRHFVADAGHELRTPVAAIRGYAELFESGVATDPDDVEHAMRRIRREAMRMGVLIDDLLLLARLDAAEWQSQETSAGVEDEVDLAGIALDAAADARAIDPERSIAVEVTGPVLVRGDGRQLHQLVANLLTNVRDHTPPLAPATVRVGSEESGTTPGIPLAVLQVIDTGPGVPVGFEDRVFERFRRADQARTRNHGGAGLGLAIVEAIALAHHGRAEVTNTGSGACFAVFLPQVAGAGEAEAQDPERHEDQAHHRAHAHR